MTIPRFVRRIAVVSMYGTYATGTILQWQVHNAGESRELILAIFILAFVIGGLLFVGTHYLRWVSARDNALDEREIAIRNAVYRTAYHFIAWFGIALLAIWYAAPYTAPSLTMATNFNVLFWGFVLLVATLPAALLAWGDRPIS